MTFSRARARREGRHAPAPSSRTTPIARCIHDAPQHHDDVSRQRKRAQHVQQLAGAAQALVPIGHQEPVHDLREHRRRIGRELTQILLDPPDRVHPRRGDGGPVERPRAGEQLEGHDAEREEIRAPVDQVAQHLLR
jgi:hypothetical protein